MHRFRDLLLALAYGALVAVTPSHAQPAPSIPKLVVTPKLGHPGDTFYLAGGGFPTSRHPRQLSVTMYCPDVYPTLYGHWTFQVTVGKDGTFAAVAEQVPTPLLVNETWCRLRARNGDDPFGVAADFYILSLANPAPSTRYTVELAPRFAMSGSDSLQESVKVKFLPGAHMRYTVTLPNTRPSHYRSQLPWNGAQALHWSASYHPQHAGKARIDVSGRLGALQGNSTVWTSIQQ